MPNEYLPDAQNANTTVPQQTPINPAPAGVSAAQATGQTPQQLARGSQISDIISQQPPVTQTGATASALRGAFQTAGSIANLLSADDWRNAADTLAARFPREVQSYQDIKDWGTLGTYATERALENTANLLITLGGGALAASAGAPAAVGVGAGAFVLSAGETKQTIEAEGGEATVQNVLPTALLNTGLEAFSFLKVFKNSGLAHHFTDAIEKSAEITGFDKILKEVVTRGGSSFLTEASTEAIQTFNNQVTAELVNNKELTEAIKVLPKEQKELIEAFLSGGFAGGLTTTATQSGVQAVDAVGRFRQSRSSRAPVQDGESVDKPQETINEQEAEVEETPDAAPKEAAPEEVIQETEESTKLAQEKAAPLLPDQNLPVAEQLNKVNEAIATNLDSLGPQQNPLPVDVAQAFLNATGFELQSERTTRSFYDVRDDQIVANEIPAELSETPLSFYEGGNLVQNTTSIRQSQAGTPRTYISGDATSLFGYKSPRVIQQIADTVEQWRSAYMPNRSIILGESRPDVFTTPSDTQGFHSAMIDTRQAQEAFQLNGQLQMPISYISINPDVIANNAFRVAQAAKVDFELKQADMFALSMATLSHEIGHAIIADNIANSNPEQKASVYQEYREFVESIPDKTFGQVLDELKSPSTLSRQFRSKELDDLPFRDVASRFFTQDQVNYLLSFEEYAAEQVARSFTGRNRVQANKGLWQRITDTLRKLFEDFSQLFTTKPNFQKWLDTLALQNYRDELLLKIPATEYKVTPTVDALRQEAGLAKPKLFPDRQDDVTGRIASIAEQDLTDSIIAAMQRTERVSTGFNKIWGTILTPLQIAEKFGVPQAGIYMERVQEYVATKMRGITRADEVSQEWIRLPQAQADTFSKVLFEISELSEAEGRAFNPSEIRSIFEEAGLGTREIELYNKIRESFSDVLARLRTAVEIETLSRYTANPRELLAELERVGPEGRAQVLEIYTQDRGPEAFAELERVGNQFDNLQSREYFPRMRFGQYVITVKRREDTGDGIREVTDIFESYESESERDAAAKAYQAEFKGRTDVDVISGVLTDTARAMYGMPQVVVKSIGDKLRESEGGLTQEQEQALIQAEADLSPGKAFLRHLRRRKNTKGFSQDAMRTYASYMSSASNHLARIEHNKDLVNALGDLRNASRGFRGDISDLERLSEYYDEHFRYLFNPENDWAAVRSFGFMWFLGFNIKSAFVNLTQMPLVTLPYLASRYGEANTVKGLTRAMGDITQHLVKRKDLKQDQQRVLDRMTQEGIIDESMVSELSGLAEGTALARIMSTNRAHRIMNDFSHYGSYMFRMTEKFNRRVTALATYELHKQGGATFEESYKAARNAVQKTQFEYAKWNRPTFQRGKELSVITLFYGYTQQFLYLALNGQRTPASRKTALYMLAIMFAFAGLQGLPGADYLLSTIDFLGTRFKQFFGLTDPRVNIREDIREIVKEMGANPDIALHGMSRYYGTGPLQLANIFGVPVPNTDISGSLSLGQPLPGLRETFQRDPSLGDYLLNGLGPVANIGGNIYKYLNDDDPDEWKSFEKTLPVALKNISKATRLAARGEETTRGGAQFVAFDSASPEHWAEIMFQGLGFTPSRVSEKWDLYGEQSTGAAYWSTRRQGVLERYAYAIVTNDKDAIVEARKDISAWNKSLESPELSTYKINNIDLQLSLNAKLRVIRLREAGLPTTARDRLFYSSVERSRER